jgi:hypothetical protein
MKKTTQNPNRVGANFDREKQTDDEWLVKNHFFKSHFLLKYS